LLGTTLRWERLSETLKEPYQTLVKAAQRAMKEGRGAVILTQSGEKFTGGNNSSFCAEQLALKAVETKGVLREIRAIAIVVPARGRDPTKEILPCKKCCRKLSEVAKKVEWDFPVILATTNKEEVIVISVSQLVDFVFEQKSQLREDTPTPQLVEIS